MPATLPTLARATTRVVLTTLLAGLLAATLAACGGDEDPASSEARTSAAEEPAPATEQPPEAREAGPITIESDDQLLRLEIPAGALPAGFDGSTLSVTFVSPEEAEREGLTGHGYYVVEPGAIELSAPAIVTRVAATEPLAEELAAGQVRMLALIGAARDLSSPELLANHVLRWDGELLSVRAETTRLATLHVLAVSHYVELVPPILAAAVGETGEATVRLSLPFDAPRDIGAGLLDVVWQGDDGLTVSSTEQSVVTITCTREGAFGYRAAGEVIGSVELLEFALAETALFTEPLDGEALERYDFEVRGQASCDGAG